MTRLWERDLFLKILALVLGVVLWFQVSGQSPELQKRVSGVPVRVRGLPDNLAVVELEPDTVTVYIRGSRSRLVNLGREDFEAWVDLRRARSGRMAYAVESVLVPRGVTLVDFEPSEVTVAVEPVKEVQKEVRGMAEGSPARGYHLGGMELDPLRVTVRGPASRVDRVAEVRVTVPLEGRSRGFQDRFRAVALDERGNQVEGVRVLPETLEVRVKLYADRMRRAVRVEPDLPAGYPIGELEITPGTVLVEGPEERVASLEAISTAPIALEGRGGEVELSAPLELPPGVTLAEGQPERVQVRLKIEGR
jgi:YbbR domain-containing protein